MFQKGVSPSEQETYPLLIYPIKKIKISGMGGAFQDRPPVLPCLLYYAGGSLGSVCGDHFPHKKGCGVVVTPVYNL